MWRSRSRSCSLNRRLPPSVRIGVEQALALVDAQGLGMDAGQLGGHRDHVDGTGMAIVGHLHSQDVAAGGSTTAARASTAARCSSVSSSGTSVSTVTSRSPVAFFLPAGTPRPLTRKVRPEGVPAGTRRVTGSAGWAR